TTLIDTRLMAKALAIGDREPALLLTVDNCGVTSEFTESVANAIRQATGLKRERLAICYSHTHSAPCLSGAVPMLFSVDIPSEHQERIDRYTGKLRDDLVAIGIQALEQRRPSQVSWATTHAGFAANRRSQIGPVDHVMPVMRIEEPDGQLRAFWLSYACHCTTLTGDNNTICGDWAGYAQQFLQEENPETLAFVSIGCAADANPFPRPGHNYARQHGREINESVMRLKEERFTPLSVEPECQMTYLDLPYDSAPSLEEWRERAAGTGPTAYHAGKWLERLEHGETLPDAYSYPLQTWTFGDSLCMVFLAGEVVADYAVRLRSVYDPERLWIGAYANDFPGYIPSRRVWQEGGYEGAEATVYFGLPNRFSEDIEDLIVTRLETIVPSQFRR
ncbi:MAG: dehydrogenase, partial [Candidatus Latescibacteria bacterium]|nr:dehydrogenase [Candidatus Latescibacterota bacterium]